MIFSRITENQTREYVPAEVSERHPDATLARPAVVLLRTGEALDPGAWSLHQYRLESCTVRELPELESLGWIDCSDLSVMINTEGARYIRAGALELFGGDA